MLTGKRKEQQGSLTQLRLPSLQHDELDSVSNDDISIMSVENPYFETKLGKLFLADCLEWLDTLPEESVDLVIADPPYNIRKAQWDTFESQEAYVEWSKEWITRVHRVLTPKGTLYVCGFSEILADIKWAAMKLFPGCKWIVWYYRNKASMGNDWGRSHESILHFRKGKGMVFNADAVRVPYNIHTTKYPNHPQAKTSQYGNGKGYVWSPNPLGARPRDVIEIPTICNTTKEKTLHPAQKPEELIQRLVLASSNEGDLVIDPFGGSGTTYVVCERYGRRWLGCELHLDYCKVIKDRIEHPEKYSSERNTTNIQALGKRRHELRYGRRTE